MIQRIQSIYLALALILTGLVGWLPLGELSAANNLYAYTIGGIQNSQNGEVIFSGWPLMALLGIICLLQIAILFGYKKRIRQMRMATFSILLMIGFVGVSWFFAHNTAKSLGDGQFALKIALAFPLVSAILNYLAIRAIGKDEALVRSVDRIR